MNNLLRKLAQYKVHHILFWLAYYVLWVNIYRGFYENIVDLMLVTLVYGISHATLYYVNQYLFIPRLLRRKRIVWFAVAFIALLVASILFMYGAISLILGDLFFDAFEGAITPWFVFFGTSNLFWVSLMLSVKAMIDNFRNRRANERKERERLETELQYLKAQVNPHFLFNTINSVYVLIGKDPKKASETLIKLSDLLRSQLYDFGSRLITIEQELEYLENYIALEKLRKGSKLDFTFLKNENVKGFSIAPLLLIPFLENSFKYVSSYADKINKIRMEVSFDRGQFRAYFFNTRDEYSVNNPDQPGGIGLKNVKRRLELLYPKAHTLEILDKPDSFQVILTLDTHEAEND